MQKRSLSVLVSSILIAGSLVYTASAAPTPKCDAVDGDYIVALNKGAMVSSEVKNIRGREIVPTFVYDAAINGFAAHLTGEDVCELRGRGTVKSVTVDGVITIDSIESAASWGLDRIDQQNLPLSKTYSYLSNGAGVTAYVIDTGIYISNSDFGGRATVGIDTVGDRQKGIDCNGHGTHVAGTIGGTKYGIAKKVNLVAVRVLNCRGSGSYSRVIAGINWVINNKAAKSVANMSLGGPADDNIDLAVRNLVASGVTTVVAAGNSNVDASTTSPARVDQAITVGATDSNDAIASFSNFGSKVDVLAPGVNIISDYLKSTSTLSGTSMAAPHVAGVWAAVLSSTYSGPNPISSWPTNLSVNGVVSINKTGTTSNLLYKAPTL